MSLKVIEDSDADELTRPLLNLLETQKLDFHETFRQLYYFRPTLLDADSPGGLGSFVTSIFEHRFELRKGDVEAT